MSENSNNYLQSLNEFQREAVENNSGATLVLAGAGSGKTRVLTYKLLHLLAKKILKPNQILAVTFTNKAAAEMKSRVSTMLNFPIDRMWLGTFHSMSLKILRNHSEKVGLKKNFLIILHKLNEMYQARKVPQQKSQVFYLLYFAFLWQLCW